MPRHHDELRSLLLRVRSEIAANRVRIAGYRLINLLNKYDPGQPRLPSGQPGGGRWTGGGDGGGIGGGGSGQQRSETVRNTTGEAAWDSVVNTYSAGGTIVSQFVVNRDGGTITSEFNPGGTAADWDERHIVRSAEGTSFAFDISGDTETISDTRSGEVVSQSVWTDFGAESAATLQPVFAPLVEEAVRRSALAGATLLFEWLSGKNDDKGTAVFGFRANEFEPGADFEAQAIWVGRLKREDVELACPRFGEVQSRTDEAAEFIKREGAYRGPQDYGTAVHEHLKNQIRALRDPNFRAETSFIKSQIETYGKFGSVRIDVLENTQQGSVCVYDIKTGRRGLSQARFKEIADNVHFRFGADKRLIIIEMRPGR